MSDISGIEVRREAMRVFRSGIVDDPAVRRRGRIGRQLPILGPDGSRAGWFVSVVVGRKLVGFLQFDPRLRLLRYSTFQTRPGTIEDCPNAVAWLDPARVVGAARRLVPRGEVLGPPRLTFDRHITRIAWAVRMRTPNATEETIYVAGDYAFLPAGGEEGTT